jgi:murein DD-endopeptidase MepM/ murein hydrolase activator NlpD
MPMLHAPKLQPIEPEYGEVVAFPRASASEPRDFGRRGERKSFSLVVDLSAEEVGLRWMRGAATLAMLCGGALLLVPEIDPAVVPQPAAPITIRNAQLSDLALPSVATEPRPEAQPSAKGVSMGEKDGLKRISGDVSEGATPDTATDYLKALATRIDVGEVMPFDRFEFVVSESSGALLYAGLDRAQGSDVELLKWNVGGQQGWFEAGTAPRASAGLMAPVAGRITSGFGARFHPILH